MIKHHPTEPKKMKQAARTLMANHKRKSQMNGEHIQRKIQKVIKQKAFLLEQNTVHYGGQEYDTEYHFYMRNIVSGKTKNRIKHMENAVETLSKRLENYKEHAAHWHKMAKMYDTLAEEIEELLAIKRAGVVEYKKKCERLKEVYKNCCIK